ncbi:cytochrome P450 [Amylocystis lapponica]|nr:cytochrome P450 [Amylocystis lapponica]
MSVITPSNLLLSFGATLVVYVTGRLVHLLIILPLKSSLRFLPGPRSPSPLYGHLRAISKAADSVLHEQWTEQYGPTLKYKSFMNANRFYTTDPRAINHIITHSMVYEKPDDARFTLAQILGEGLLFVEGDSHRQQRRVLNPAFGPTHIRELTGIFVEKSIQLRDMWSAQISDSHEPVRLDIIPGLTRMSLDVIGLAGFGYDFGALNLDGKPNELHEAFHTMIAYLTTGVSVLGILQARFPVLRFIVRVPRFLRLSVGPPFTVRLQPSHRQQSQREAQRVMRRVGMQLIAEKKAAITKESRAQSKETAGPGLHGRDLLTLLLKANIATDIPVHQRLSDEDVLAQVPRFLVAGHETTSTATMWCLYALTQAPAVQQKLREELLRVDTDAPDMDELNALPYLDAVVRETMRVHAPVPATHRVAARDDVVPLGTPVVDTRGQVHESIKIDKGQGIFISITAVNRAKALWGEDAFEFRPERWEKLAGAMTGIPGVWAHLLSFLGGPRACIGYRFSLVEIKALLFTLVRAFEFELAVAPEDIVKRAGIVQLCLLRHEMEKGPQMPMLIRPYRRA